MATPGGAGVAAGDLAAPTCGFLAQHARPGVDAVVVGYPGPLPGAVRPRRWPPPARQLVFDPLVSLWDTFAGDRGLVGCGGAVGRPSGRSIEVAFGLADLVLADTWAHAAYYRGVRRAAARLAVVPVGALPEPRAPGSARRLDAAPAVGRVPVRQVEPPARRRHRAGGGRAAAREPFRFVLAGEGQLSAELRARIARAASPTWSGSARSRRAELRAPHAGRRRLPGRLRRSEKAARVVPNKVFDALACGRPVVTRTRGRPRELLHDGEARPAGAGRRRCGPGCCAAPAARRRCAHGSARRRSALYRRRFTPAAVADELLAALERVA